MKYFTPEEITVFKEIRETPDTDEWQTYLSFKITSDWPGHYPKDSEAYEKVILAWIDTQAEEEMLLFQLIYDLIEAVINASKIHGTISGFTINYQSPTAILKELARSAVRAFFDWSRGLDEILKNLQIDAKYDYEDYGGHANEAAFEMLENALGMNKDLKWSAHSAFTKFNWWLNDLVSEGYVNYPQGQKEIVDKAVKLHYLQALWEKYVAPQQSKRLIEGFKGQFRFMYKFGTKVITVDDAPNLILPETPNSTYIDSWEKQQIFWCIEKGNRLWLVDIVEQKGWGWVRLEHDQKPMLVHPQTEEEVYFQSHTAYEYDEPKAYHPLKSPKGFRCPFLHTPAQLLKNARYSGFKDFAPIIDFKAQNIDISQWQILTGDYPKAGGWGYHVFLEQFVWLNPAHTYWTKLGTVSTTDRFDKPDEFEHISFAKNPDPLTTWLHYYPVENGNHTVWPIELLGSEMALHGDRSYGESVLERYIKEVYPHWSEIQINTFVYFATPYDSSFQKGN